MHTLGRRDVAVALCVCAVAGLSALAGYDTGRSCLDCHQMASGKLAAHPVFVPITGVAREMSPGVPLEAGEITCLSCHTGHKPTGRPLFLRFAPPELCAQCHEADGKWDRGHAYYADSIHGGTKLVLPDDNPSLTGADPVTARCQSCHGASEVPPGIPTPRSAIAAEHSHPMRQYAPAESGDYRRVSELDATVRLFDGKIGCATCHRLYGASEFHLVAPKTRGRLCLSCHSFGVVETAANDM
jgi:predicted CXXCH cytochrome family protein